MLENFFLELNINSLEFIIIYFIEFLTEFWDLKKLG